MPRTYTMSEKAMAARRAAGVNARAAANSPGSLLKRVAGRSPEEITAAARALTPAEAARLSALLASAANAEGGES